MTEKKGLCISFFDRWLTFEGDGSSYYNFTSTGSIEPDRGYVPFPLLTPEPNEDSVKTDCDYLLAFPVLSPGNAAPAETPLDTNACHCVRGLSNEQLLIETEKTVAV